MTFGEAKQSMMDFCSACDISKEVTEIWYNILDQYPEDDEFDPKRVNLNLINSKSHTEH